VLSGRTAERPESVLQAIGQRHETLAAQHDMDMLEAAIGQPEVIEPVDQWLARDGDAEIGHVGEIRQTHATGLVNLTENDLAPRFTQDRCRAVPASG